jgi:protein arginine N-methyltransferase 2
MTDPNIEISHVQIDVDLDIQEILLAASQHNIPKLRQLLRSNNVGAENPANVKDPETGYTPLHAAIAACEPDDEGEEDSKTTAVNGEEGKEDGELALASETVKFLLQEGAIWNDLDKNDETPGCLARRFGLSELYELMVDAGVRAELLFNRLEGYEMLVDDDEDEEEEEEDKADN